jgi:hypothetical protein
MLGLPWQSSSVCIMRRQDFLKPQLQDLESGSKTLCKQFQIWHLSVYPHFCQWQPFSVRCNACLVCEPLMLLNGTYMLHTSSTSCVAFCKITSLHGINLHGIDLCPWAWLLIGIHTCVPLSHSHTMPPRNSLAGGICPVLLTGTFGCAIWRSAGRSS